jgi:hypothetical protein
MIFITSLIDINTYTRNKTIIINFSRNIRVNKIYKMDTVIFFSTDEQGDKWKEQGSKAVD